MISGNNKGVGRRKLGIRTSECEGGVDELLRIG